MLTYNNIHMHCVKDYAGTRKANVRKKGTSNPLSELHSI